jgi:RimJ/RimL family protein N-acetyltransferase
MSHARDYSVNETLNDGTRVTIRALRRDDRNRFVEAFRLLKKDSIYTRFFAHRSDLSDVEIDRAVDVDFVSEVALVVTTEGASGETIIASARYVATDAERAAEAAFVVEEDYQRRGIASRLLAHLAGLACLGGLTRFEASVLSDNHAMLAVFRRSGFPIEERRDRDVIYLTLVLAADGECA